jgi:putative peptide zinc metalloprotease protein
LHPFIFVLLIILKKDGVLMKINLNSRLELHPLEIRKEKKLFIIEDKVTGDFFEMPEICVAAINSIIARNHLEDIEKDLKNRFPHEDVDIIEFTHQLLELNLVEAVDGELVQISIIGQPSERVSFTNKIPARIGRIFFNSISTKIYMLLFLANVALLAVHPGLFPHYKDLFIFDIMFQNILFWMLISFFLVLIHEFGHILAIRAHGLPTNVNLGHRLFFIVLESDLSQGWKLSSRERNILFFGGLSLDQIVLFLALILQILFPGSVVFTGVMALIVLDTFLRLIYQGAVFVKTDLYYVLENVTGCYNLMENAKAMIFKGKEEATVFEGEKRTIYMYSVLYVIGLFLSLLLFVFYYIPQLVYTVIKVIPGLSEPMSSIAFLDAIFVLFQVALMLGLLIYSWSKKYRMKFKRAS